MARKIKDPGLGYNSSENVQSFINPDGSSNITHLNREKNIDDLYSYLISVSWTRFFSFILIGYMAINAIFACLYIFLGIHQLSSSTGILWKDFLNAFFFSAQTITTVGYGTIAPTGIAAGIISSLEALIGLLSFSFITGLLYGRFSKPKSSILFSDSLILREFENSRALMFRLVSRRTSIMIEPEIKVTLSLSEKEKSGEFKRTFYDLKLKRSAVTYLPTMWTIVHEINTDSPLFNFTDEEISRLNAKLFILFQYHEDSFSQKVYQIHSYDFKNLKTGCKFQSSASFDENGKTILDHNLLNKTMPLD